MRKCGKCGFNNADDAVFCNGCGVKIEAPAQATPSVSASSSAPAQKKPSFAAQKVNKLSEPVAGWLVCISGSRRGEDYRILSKNNLIGQDDSSDINLRGNDAVKGSNFATIAYYSKQNAFYLIPGDSSEVMKIGEETVEIPTILKNGDLIEIGECEYKFVSFCNEEFKWE